MSKEHKLKIFERYYLDILKEGKSFEVRNKKDKNGKDKDFQVGDIIKFNIVNEKTKELECLVKQKYIIRYIHSGLGLVDDYVILAIETKNSEG